MKILNVKVTDVVTVLNKENIGSGNVETVQCLIELPQSFDGLTTIASFKKDGKVYDRAVINNECKVPQEVLKEPGYVFFGVYGYESTEDDLILRVSPIVSGFSVGEGSYMGVGENTITPIEPSEYERYIQAMDQIKKEAQKIIDDFTAEDVVFLDGDTFQEKYEEGEIGGVYLGTEEPKEGFYNVWVDPDEPYDMNELIERYNKNAEEREAEINQIAEGVKDMATAIQFATFEVNEKMELVINTAEKLKNTKFVLNEETGELEVKIDE